MKIKIIRHSERLDYANPLYWMVCIGQYWNDPPLTRNGTEMANKYGIELAQNNFRPKYIFTSPYQRTIVTATEIIKSLDNPELKIEPLLSEYQKSNRHTVSLYPNGIEATYNNKYVGYNFPETYDEFEKRVIYILEKLIQDYDDDFAIITHGEFLKVMTIYLQQKYPDIILSNSKIQYLATIEFDFDKNNNTIIENSIKFNF